eukprot:CAMPEP_0170184646 /NCGR_PEP_ID=MMETSP0040_2-20121228/34270_1 /TAXON_ID=641309 /ORGANISM="Lotharella oceanica, Strain CCMP622" /LENGTH=42 /DNA_ID= /DNA_START= /DNA_END= /DNA_ORIENTATION=
MTNVHASTQQEQRAAVSTSACRVPSVVLVLVQTEGQQTVDHA